MARGATGPLYTARWAPGPSRRAEASRGPSTAWRQSASAGRAARCAIAPLPRLPTPTRLRRRPRDHLV